MQGSECKKVILVVDDDPSILEVFGLLFSDGPYDVVLMENGRAALQVVGALSPDVILLDLIMPLMDGWEVMQTLQGDPALRAIPVIVLSADGNAARKAAELQAADFCPKPFDVDEVLEKVERLLARVA